MRGLALSAALWVLGTGLVSAQTGKIEGAVRDQTGAPIHGAQILIVGTAFSSLTNAHGYYFINNVPPGTVVVRAAFIGYKWTEVEGLRVRAGQTITQDIQLEASPVQLEDVTVVAAGNPLVPRDEVTTKQRIDGEFTAEPAGRPGRAGSAAAAGCGREPRRNDPVHPRGARRRGGVLPRRRVDAAGQPRQRFRSGRNQFHGLLVGSGGEFRGLREHGPFAEPRQHRRVKHRSHAWPAMAPRKCR